MKRPPLTPEEMDAIASAYLDGDSIPDICERFDVVQGTVSVVRARLGIAPRKIKRPIAEVNAEVASMYEQGLSIKSIAKRLHLHGQTVKRYLDARGIKIRPIGKHKRPAFKPRIDKTLLETLYHTEKLSALTIGQRYGVSKNTVWNWLVAYGIPRVTPQERADLRPCFGHPSWRGGITPFRTALVTRLSAWKRAVKQRDGRHCQKCASKKQLEVHHTKPLRDLIREFKESFPAIDVGTPEGLDFALKTVVKMHAIEMGITLCRSCHEEEDEWRARFMSRVNVRSKDREGVSRTVAVNELVGSPVLSMPSV